MLLSRVLQRVVSVTKWPYAVWYWGLCIGTCLMHLIKKSQGRLQSQQDHQYRANESLPSAAHTLYILYHHYIWPLGHTRCDNVIIRVSITGVTEFSFGLFAFSTYLLFQYYQLYLLKHIHEGASYRLHILTFVLCLLSRAATCAAIANCQFPIGGTPLVPRQFANIHAMLL